VANPSSTPRRQRGRRLPGISSAKPSPRSVPEGEERERKKMIWEVSRVPMQRSRLR